MPYVIEPSAGVGRPLLAFLVDAYDEEEVAGRERTVLRLHPQIAPVKAAVLPLIGKDPAMVERARSLFPLSPAPVRGSARGRLLRATETPSSSA